jgi:hypothetical protein
MVIPQSTSFQFITSINTVAHDEETRRKVRSHARRQKLSDENSLPKSRKSSTQKERISKFRLKPSAQPGDAESSDKSISRNNGNSSSKKPSSIPKLHGPVLGGHTEEQNKSSNFTPTMVSRELALVVARELPSFPMLRIETTPLTETLLKYCFTVCLCPREAMVEKWFDRAGAPTYMMTCRLTLTPNAASAGSYSYYSSQL